MAFLELLNVDKSFGGVKAVHNFTLTVQEGELVGLIGPNGAGKTTVFNLITGLYPVDNGQIFFQGEDLSPLKPYEIIPRGIARTFQNLRLFARVSALENVITAYRKCQYSFLEALFHAGRWKLSEAEARKRALELLDFMGLADKALQAA
ncbi:MAG TPA: ATP-binding cassette domain-containing protein, partial [Acetomicrobium sp.]|nr:ATP-binding cassette domain-containing protein [Acetomicrobium sp.]